MSNKNKSLISSYEKNQSLLPSTDMNNDNNDDNNDDNNKNNNDDDGDGDNDNNNENSQTSIHQIHKDAMQLKKKNYQLRRDAKITPWISQKEFESVGYAILSNYSSYIKNNNAALDTTTLLTTTNNDVDKTHNVLSIHQAMEQIAVWKTRATEAKIPISIEITFALIQVMLNDDNNNNNYFPMVSTTQLRLAYSGAILRGVNGLTDVLQQQRTQAMSISILCSQLGIPSWLVDVRHEATHNALPSLSILRLAANTLLDYIQCEFWIPSCPGLKQYLVANEMITNNNDNNQNDNDTTTTTNTTTTNMYKDNKRSTSTPLSLSTTSQSSQRQQPIQKPIDYLLRYQSVITTLYAPIPPPPTTTTVENVTPSTPKATKKETKQKIPPLKKSRTSSNNDSTKTTPKSKQFNPFPPMNLDIFESSTDEDDDDDDDNWGGFSSYNSNSLWSPPSIAGSSSNRFALLAPIEKPRKKSNNNNKKKSPLTKATKNNSNNSNQQSKKRKRKKNKKPPLQERPCDYGRAFVKRVPIQEGYKVALQFLLGEEGGMMIMNPTSAAVTTTTTCKESIADKINGVLLPTSQSIYPTSNEGIAKIRDCYAPLIITLVQAWPGFAVTLIIRLVDTIISIEQSFWNHIMLSNSGYTVATITTTTTTTITVDPISARKLYFLASWVRYLLSRRFISALKHQKDNDSAKTTADADVATTNEKSSNNNPTNGDSSSPPSLSCHLDQFASLDELVLSSSLSSSYEIKYPLNSLCDKCQAANNNMNEDSSLLSTLFSTSREVAKILTDILGKSRITNFGYPQSTPHHHTEMNDINNTTIEPLQRDDKDVAQQEQQQQQQHSEMPLPTPRPKWVQCQTWDTCGIGQLPGHNIE